MKTAMMAAVMAGCRVDVMQVMAHPMSSQHSQSQSKLQVASGGWDRGAGVGQATQFIAVYSNAGPNAQLMPLPLEKSSEDSDTEEFGGDAANMTHTVVSKRNFNMMSKYGVKIFKSAGPEGTGMGLFTNKSLAMGTTIPVKGIWFGNVGEVNTWLQEQNPRTAEAMAKKIIEVNFSKPPDAEKQCKYLVMTSVVGYVNAFTNISQRPNAQLLFNPDRPLGVYSVSLRLLHDLGEGKEILVAYGAKHMVGERKKKAVKSKKLKAAESQH